MIRLKTRYEVEMVPHAEHPRPQAERGDWLCLNGDWEFKKRSVEKEIVYEGKIVVPFSPESLLSGIEEGFVLNAGESLVYKRKILITENLLRGRTVVHFDAVDSECAVYWNGVRVGVHKGGYTPFEVDISAQAKAGENEIEVVCYDDATRNGGAKGKQKDKRGGIWYTPQSGIWQTVWVESMPETYISNVKVKPNPEDNTVVIEADGGPMEITVVDEGKAIIRGKFEHKATLQYDFEHWSPENPKLYYFILQNEAGDVVRSYFGVRSFGKAEDENGKMRLTLNGKPYFFNGVLDQGYWSDGMLTPPCDRAMEDELSLIKDMGFNTVRKHIKIEPMRWYYHCDRLGLVVWQDFVNGGDKYKFTHVALWPFLGFKHKDSDYKYFGRANEEGRAEFLQAADDTVNALYNCVCIGMWVPFNEGWGQFDSTQLTAHIRELDDSRIIDSVSGWHDQGKDKTELRSMHTYYKRLRVPRRDPRPVILSEFGGYSMKIAGHVFNEKRNFGYKKFKSNHKLVAALEKLYLKKICKLIRKGLSGCIYTQVSDVEDELNGLRTYDRKVVKISVKDMARINRQVKKQADEIK